MLYFLTACPIRYQPGEYVNKPRAGFLLSRHWRDTAQGTEITLWLATDDGAQRVVLPVQESVTFIPASTRRRSKRCCRTSARCACSLSS